MPRRNNPKQSTPLRSVSCGSKKRYATKQGAEYVIADKQALIGDDTELRAYRCPHCAKWHLTSR